MRTLANPFNITPTEEYMLKNKIAMGSFIPNTSISTKKERRFSTYMSVDLVGMSKASSLTSAQFTAKLGTKIKKKKEKTGSPPAEGQGEPPNQIASPKAMQPKQEDLLTKLVDENIKGTESDNSDDSRYMFDEGHNVASSDFLAKNYKEMQKKEEILKEIERKRNEKKRVPLEPNRFYEIKTENPGDLWRKDKKTLELANPIYGEKERFYLEKDKNFLQKRRQELVHKMLSYFIEL